MTTKVIIAIVIFVRLALILLPSFKIDMTDWQAWTDKLVQVGPNNFYSPGYFADYFPGYLYFLWVWGELLKLLNPTFNFYSDSFANSLKFFTNVFDIGTAYLIFKIVSKYQKKTWSALSSILYLANPALIFNSSVWGQVDGILTFFVLLSFYYFEGKKPKSGSIYYSLALLIKPQALAALPLLIINLVKNVRLKNFLTSLIILILLPLIISLPFFLGNPLFGLWELFLKTAQGYQYTSLFAFNFWALVGWWKPDNVTWFNLTYQVWGVILYLIGLILIVFPFIRRSDSKIIYFAVALLFFDFFLFPTRVHERYLFPLFAFFAIIISFYRSKIMLFLYLLTAIIHFLNLWYVYFYFNFIYSNNLYAKNLIYTFIDKNYQVFAILSLIIFAWLTVIYYKNEKS